MDTILQADIFFFITSIAIFLITIVVLIALFFFIQILRDVRYTSKKIREETDRIVSDVEDFRKFVREEGKRALNIKDLIGGVLQVFRGRRRTRKTAPKKEA